MDGSCGPQTEVKVSGERGSTVELPSSRSSDLFFYFSFFFLFCFFNIKLLIIPFSYLEIQFNIKTFGKNLLIESLNCLILLSIYT